MGPYTKTHGNLGTIYFTARNTTTGQLKLMPPPSGFMPKASTTASEADRKSLLKGSTSSSGVAERLKREHGEKG